MNANLLNESIKAKGMQTNTKHAIVVSKHFVTKFLKRWQDIWGQTQRGLPKHEIKTRHSFPFYIKQSWKEYISKNEQCNLCSYREKTRRKRHTGEGFREKTSIFTHLEIGTTFSLTTSSNWRDLLWKAQGLAPIRSYPCHCKIKSCHHFLI